MHNGDDDDDDICPVCESECTCNNKRPSPPTIEQSQQQTQSLKIRFTVPPNLLSTLKNQPKSQENPTLITSVAAQDGSERLYSSITKKRGRPAKIEADTRRASAAARTAVVGHQAKQKLTRLQHGARGAAPAVKSGSRKFKNRQQQRSQSQIIRSNLYGNSSTESDSEETTSVPFPTFVSTFSSPIVGANADSDDSDSSELSSLPDPGDDSCLEEEEERYVIQEQNGGREKARVRREILECDDEPRLFNTPRQNSWEIRARMRTSAGDIVDEGTINATDSDSDTDDDDDEEEDDDDADAEADGDNDMDGDGTTSDCLPSGASWCNFDDEDFDAEVFFASLSDSETSTSVFDHVFEAPNEDDDFSDGSHPSQIGAIPVEDAAAAGLLSPLNRLVTFDSAAVLVTKDWNGQPVFTNGTDITMGMLDIDFELNVVAQHKAATQQPDSITSGADDDEEMWMQSDEDLNGDSDHGDTTDEDRTALRGVQTPSGVVLFRFPTPPVSSIDPLSTLSPMSKKKTSSLKLRKRFDKLKRSGGPPTKPSEILARTGSVMSSEAQQAEEGTCDDVASVDAASSSWSSTFRPPAMGQFDAGNDPCMQHVIINGESNVDIPSPMSQYERTRRGSGSSRGRKRNAIRNESPASKRYCQSPVSSRSRSTDHRHIPSTRATPEASLPPQPIDLDDVLETSLLEALPTDDADDKASGTEAGRYINRWDRVPMGTFRRTRNNGGISDQLESVMEWAPNQASVSDGFCYGSPGGSLMRSGPLFSPHNEASWPQGISSSSRPFDVQSPVIAPRHTDGDRTPTSSHMHQQFALGNSPPDHPSPRILSHKERRKEKRRQEQERTRPLISSGL